MEFEEQSQKKLKRDKPNKKWSEKEVLSILEFLQKSPEIEKPTAQIFYNKLIEETGIDASWSMIRWKVRNLKRCFNKVNEWHRSSTGEGILQPDNIFSLKRKMLKKCPCYDELNQIFGKKSGAINALNICDTLDESAFRDAVVDTADTDSSSQLTEVKIELGIPELQETPTTSTSTCFARRKPQMITKHKKKNAINSSIAQLTELQRERTAIQKLKLEYEKDMQERRLKLDEERFRAEQEWRSKEFELRKLEIEKNERIAMYEIEMKYKNNK